MNIIKGNLRIRNTTAKDTEQMIAQFTDLCLVSNDVLNLVSFYEKLFGVSAGEKSEYHSSVNVGGLLLTIDRADMEYVASAF